MSEYQILTVLAAFAFLYSIVASRLDRTPLNGAVVYLFCGLACGPYGLQLIELNFDAEVIKRLAEFTLALVLFTDSANADFTVLRKVKDIPFRLLLFGLPLTIAFGFVVGSLLFDGLGAFEIALLAIMLAPTDAALGQAVATNPVVPASVRASLNVESGLNDGICVPVLLLFLALAAGSVEGDEAVSLLVRLPIQQIGVGVVVGVVLAILGGLALRLCSARGWVGARWVQIPVITLALLCFASSQWMGGSGFIACFVGGLVFGGLAKQHKEQVLGGAESTGNLLALLTWFAFGAAVFGQSFAQLTWQVFLYAILSLTIVRMLPVFVCVAGLGLRNDTKLFLGWFGPRGLASIVFIVMVLDENLPGENQLAAIVTWTVALSIIAHGLSANPLAKAFGRRIASRGGSILRTGS